MADKKKQGKTSKSRPRPTDKAARADSAAQETLPAPSPPALDAGGDTDASFSRQAGSLSHGPPAPDAVADTDAEQTSSTGDFLVVGIGASAGGLTALKDLFEAMPTPNGIGFIVIQHLDPTHDSMLVEVLTRYTRMRVVPAEEGLPVAPDSVYVIPPNTSLTISQGCLHLSAPQERRGLRLPANLFLQSLAEDRREKAVGIILSGTGSDGTSGLKSIHELGGLVMVQDPRTAEYDGMPASAIASGVVDYVLPVSQMPDALLKYARHPYTVAPQQLDQQADSDPVHLQQIFELLRQHARYDFRYYKRSTVLRRIERRMGVHHLETIADYVRLRFSAL